MFLKHHLNRRKQIDMDKIEIDKLNGYAMNSPWQTKLRMSYENQVEKLASTGNETCQYRSKSVWILVSLAVVLMARTPPQLMSAEPSETFYSLCIKSQL